MSQVALLTVTHDPKGINIELFQQLQEDLEGIYGELFITISDLSSIELVKEMERSQFNVKIIPKKGAAQARREVVKFGLTGQCQYFHYCDFDRLLTWSKNHLDELKNMVSDMPNYDYLILGRTERAMNTHPLEWIETEKITNKICSLELGKEVDITAGSCSFSRECANNINNFSKEKMTDAEWVMIIHRIAKLNVEYAQVEGLEYHEDTNGITRIISDSEKWLRRLQLSLIISETAFKIGK
ncbi:MULTISPECIES: hypothetical protein [Bacillus cereus group]|uniref:hypothetical protein n=1 Tax=Bacillus cereus group TaxID=86661 RepID=UPI0009B52B8F|nr:MULTISPECIES: hypothetical protein [Bacillus cereus group]MDA1995920.1 hypothetical protein [Bacillus cereus]MDA2001853.1 hypothetical protein [Bacillus cereus]MDA3654535.1 hypothetical protein [Bacillus cereus]WPQ43984.1 hypothetical protein SH594_29975 [Bacillus cereus]